MFLNLTAYERQRIRYLDKKGLTHKQINKRLNIKRELIENYLFHYITHKIHTGRKKCNLCGKFKDLQTEYHFRNKNKNYYHPYCKSCRSKIKKNNRLKDIYNLIKIKRGKGKIN